MPAPSRIQIHQIRDKLHFLKDATRNPLRHGGTIKDFAERLGISDATLNDAMRPGKLSLSTSNIDVIASVCGFDRKWYAERRNQASDAQAGDGFRIS